MDAKDLRIGNYVMYNGIITEIYYLSEQAHTEIASCVEYRDLQPILITDELIKDNNWEFGTCGDLSFLHGYNPNEYNIYKDYECVTSVKYLHEYQNLYYDIYKKELILSNNS